MTAATAFAGWCVGHVFAGTHEKNKTAPTNSLNNQQTYYGVGDLAAVQGNPVSSFLFALGFARALTIKPGEIGEISSLSDYFKKHATSARLYGVGYIAGSLLVYSHPALAVAQLAWGAGYLDFDKALNKDFISDLGKVLRQGLPIFAPNHAAEQRRALNDMIDRIADLVERQSEEDPAGLGADETSRHIREIFEQHPRQSEAGATIVKQGPSSSVMQRVSGVMSDVYSRGVLLPGLLLGGTYAGLRAGVDVITKGAVLDYSIASGHVCGVTLGSLIVLTLEHRRKRRDKKTHLALRALCEMYSPEKKVNKQSLDMPSP